MALFTPEKLNSVHQLVTAHRGRCPLVLCFQRPDGSSIFVGAHERFGVTPSLELETAVNQKFGEKTYYAKVDTSLPEKARRSWEKKTAANGSGGDE